MPDLQQALGAAGLTSNVPVTLINDSAMRLLRELCTRHGKVECNMRIANPGIVLDIFADGKITNHTLQLDARGVWNISTTIPI